MYQSETKSDVMTELALERTILAKQRTTLAEISVFLSVVGLSLLLFKFFDNFLIRLPGALGILIATICIIKLLGEYKLSKKSVEEIYAKNKIYFEKYLG